MDYDSKPNRNLQTLVAEDDRPREKAKKLGFGALTKAELIAVFIGIGSPGENVVDLCNRILRDNDDKLNNVARLSYRQLMNTYHGIGEVKALEILAAMELARRYHSEKFDEKPQIRSSVDAYECLKSALDSLSHEEVHVLLLDRSKRVIRRERISSGGTAMTVADVKMIMKPAVEHLADGIILAHNHPGGSRRPSKMDDELTANVRAACKTMGIDLVDHIIVCQGNGYYSYNDESRL
ncbi:MAG: DNA repair protein RadC [Bacteroidales bacterium]|nr:DNA repair protein RadC [Candidatus Sodaliphilus aphodohippi]